MKQVVLASSSATTAGTVNLILPFLLPRPFDAGTPHRLTVVRKFLGIL
jgi:hypothetical protein